MDASDHPRDGAPTAGSPASDGGGPRLGRRSVLGLAAAGAGAAALGGLGTAWAGDEPSQAATPDRPPPAAGLFSNEETRLAFRNHGMHFEFLDQPITPVASHFQLVHFDVPQLSAAGYSFTIGGQVAYPRTITLDELKQRPTVRQPSVMACAGNGRSFTHPRSIYVPWFSEALGAFEYTGTPLGPLLEEAGLLDDAVEVVFTGHDEGIDLGVRHHFERALPIDEAMAEGVILAWDANGGPLPPAHGFPLRLVVPSWYGMASVKWLKAITVINHPFQGVQQKLVYRLSFSSSDLGRPVQKKFVRAAIKPPGIPDLISRKRFVDAGPVELRGMAWSGFGAIERVEISTDDRHTFSPATLEPPASPHTWTPWRFTWNARPGEHILAARATDVTGNTQPLEPLWNVQGMAQNGVERIAVHVS
ncbi:MAG: sulfite oxidase [Blastococcus sp.]|nr:sulfite oxidase [Blastococcus sp.]